MTALLLRLPLVVLKKLVRLRLLATAPLKRCDALEHGKSYCFSCAHILSSHDAYSVNTLHFPSFRDLQPFHKTSILTARIRLFLHLILRRQNAILTLTMKQLRTVRPHDRTITVQH